MGATTEIAWTDATWNPTRGCSRVSEGCQKCYAERVARRFSGAGAPYEGLLHSSGAWNGKITLAENHLLDPIRWGRGRRIFVDSMSDLFHENVPFEYVDKVFAVMACTTRHTYQILTKRPERMLEYFARLRWNVGLFGDDDKGNTYEEMVRWHGGPRQGCPDQIHPGYVYREWRPNRGRGGYDNCGPTWPLENVWLGVSCENQATADERIPLLCRVPANVHFLSLEPLLGPIRFDHRHSHCPTHDYAGGFCIGPCVDRVRPIWAIIGGESGPGARPMDAQWAIDIRRQCDAAGTAFFMKQLSGLRPEGRLEHFPVSLQVREWPQIP